MDQINIDGFNLQEIGNLWDDFDPDFNLPLIIGLSTGLGVLFLGLLILSIYFSFFNNGNSIFLGSNFNIPGEFDDEESRLHDEAEYLPNLNERERELYQLGENFTKNYPPQANPIGSTLNQEDRDYILDRGIQAYAFESEHLLEENIDSVLIEDKLDVRFTSIEENSAILNYPLPIHENDTVYFEVKLFEFSPDAHVSIGLATKPYPGFRLPGYNKYSIAYESNGTVRINQPFYSPQVWNKLIEGDVIGVGFKPRSGTIFFTHNGKKLLEATHNVKFDLFPIIGVKGGPARLNVNLGQLGFVFIEANVKKWGFGSVYGTIGIPPAYGKEIVNDTVLDKGEELPPNYPSEEETFFGPSALLTNQRNYGAIPTPSSQQGNNNKPNKIISSPPSYNGELDEPKPEVENETPEVSSGVDNIRERLYERRSSTFDQQNNQYDALAITKSNPDTPNTSNISKQQQQGEVEEPVKVVITESDSKTSEEVTKAVEPQESESKQSSPEPESSDANEGDNERDTSQEQTPEPTQPSSSIQNTPSSSSSRKSTPGKKKKPKKKGKRKGKRNW
ncbi:hypothetical protein BN7_2761 [Wickerhamomyces ciferrii]|uniref:B30.2/SPRY domain-containing protein n=1 Tax=Wickerhamomyces ciferrii (strain ATCC 14091 / BCRC 22168 / CBS 111 / JCM 3599 / NBRC 0793 / NRRL Y-1031 F-60-10) TaxID=1206466 RepID=K0KPA1_WICCF|nr:uncharacterized protein BN7_2761 [Wickerhamomyces ciferrii]CCH43214.1 hypothetical protein BN7_2761 [Wickerhamomyces ciferrii]